MNMSECLLDAVYSCISLVLQVHVFCQVWVSGECWPCTLPSVGVWGMLAVYVAAKLTEFLDAPIYGALGGFSGHSIKHLLSAAGVVILAAALLRRRPLGRIYNTDRQAR